MGIITVLNPRSSVCQNHFVNADCVVTLGGGAHFAVFCDPTVKMTDLESGHLGSNPWGRSLVFLCLFPLGDVEMMLVAPAAVS